MTAKQCHAPGCTNPQRHGRGYLYCDDCAPKMKAETKLRCDAAWRAAHPKDAAGWRERNLLQRWGLTPDQWDAMLESQGGRCGNLACRTTDPGKRGWHVDHDHGCCPGNKKSCGKCIRGLLCGRCNRAAGLVDDDPNALRGLADFIDRHAARASSDAVADQR